MSRTRPDISVVIPTYRRPDMLRRAVESVRRQQHADWELIISDDESPPGETWAYLQKLAENDVRIRVLRHPGTAGQINNNNFVMSHAAGEWIKPLFDDDELKPDALSSLLRAAKSRPGVSLVFCRAEQRVNGKRRRSGRVRGHPILEGLSGKDALRAFCLLDLEVGTPLQSLIHRRVWDADLRWEALPEMQSAHDLWFLLRCLRHGDLLMLNRIRVVQHLGHPTGTTLMDGQPEKLDRDFEILLENVYAEVQFKDQLPGLEILQQQLRGVRALDRFRRRRWKEGLALWRACPLPQARRGVFRWLCKKYLPGIPDQVPRTRWSLVTGE
jgi:hypothetical protein